MALVGMAARRTRGLRLRSSASPHSTGCELHRRLAVLPRPPAAPVSAQDHPSFNAALYTLNLIIPAPGIGQASDWNPCGELLAVAAGLRSLGWLLTITVIAAITRTLSRN